MGTEWLENKPDRRAEAENESPRIETARDEPRPLATSSGTEPSDAEMERAIVEAVMARAIDVARTLASRLEDDVERQRSSDITREREKRR